MPNLKQEVTMQNSNYLRVLLNNVWVFAAFICVFFIVACSDEGNISQEEIDDEVITTIITGEPKQSSITLSALAGSYVSDSIQEGGDRIILEVIGGEIFANFTGKDNFKLELSNNLLLAVDEGISIEIVQNYTDVQTVTTLRFSKKSYQRVLFKGACAGLGRFAPTSSYTKLTISGWKVMIACDYKKKSKHRENALHEINRQLENIEKSIPSSALQTIRDTVFWLEYPFIGDTDAAFHPSREWLIENGFNPEKAGGIELDYNIYLWREEQPWAIFHELSHAYHYKVIGDNNKKVIQAFNEAVVSGKYENVNHIDGQIVRAYALTDEFEYFAETSEAYFGLNDLQPFDKEELSHFDPLGYSLIKETWFNQDK